MYRHSLRLFFAVVAAVFTVCAAGARVHWPQGVAKPSWAPRDTNKVEIKVDTTILQTALPVFVFTPAVYQYYIYPDTTAMLHPEISRNKPHLLWLDEARAAKRKEVGMLQRFMMTNPQLVHYNLESLPEAPKMYIGKVDPTRHTIEIQEMAPIDPGKLQVELNRRHWLRTFTSSLQFSQAYISPNWYQGGSNNLNMLANIYYNVKLNPKYHPNLLFESTFQYKLGLNSAPEDSLRSYAISEDLLQVNSTFGVKAARRWYYSLTGQFKTQMLNSYVKNKYNLKSAFLSPAELTAGLGMTYNYASKNKRFTFDASLAPLSYNMKICIRPNDEVPHASFNIPTDQKTVSKFGSTAECKLMWQMTKNIQFRSRLFFFSDYNYAQADWENTLAMDINRYLSTQIYVHARYDTTTPPSSDPSWHKLQVKEILSFGVSYRFSSI